MADPRPITFLSDYGYDDEFAGVCRAVIAQIAPEALVVDLGQGVPRQDVQAGALQLERSIPFCSPGVHLAVVDPGVGSARRGVAVMTADEQRIFVGPDNGLLWPAVTRFGGPLEAVSLDQSPYRLEPVSATFHGRDLFAPVAAHLSMGARLGEAGEQIDPESMERLALTQASVEQGRAVTHPIDRDGYGNLALDLTVEQAGEAGLEAGGRLVVHAPDGRFEATWVRTFADVLPGELLLYKDSAGRLALAANGGDAAALLTAAVGTELSIEAN